MAIPDGQRGPLVEEGSRLLSLRRRACSRRSLAFVHAVTREVLEEIARDRVRALKTRDAEKAALTAEAVAADLAYQAALSPADPKPRLLVALGAENLRASRYREPLQTTHLRTVLRAMDARGLLRLSPGRRQQQGERRGTLSGVRAGPRLLELAAGFGATDLQDFREEAPAEAIVLKSLKGGHWDGPARLAEYADTAETARMRAELTAVNQRLAELRLEVLPGGEGPAVDSRDRALRRIFNGGFDRGGRLFGGFWQTMKREHRKARLRMWEPRAGRLERHVTADFSSLFLRLAYASRGVQPPGGDLYRLTGMTDGESDANGESRGAVKRLVGAAFFVGSPLRRWPRDIAQSGLARGWRVAEVLQALQARHPRVADILAGGSGIGLRLMWEESELLLSVLAKAHAAGLPALPLHDAVLVPESRAEEARGMMLEAFRERTGFAGAVSLS